MPGFGSTEPIYGDGGIKRCETTSRKRHGRADYAALSDMRCDRCAYVNLTNGLVDLTSSGPHPTDGNRGYLGGSCRKIGQPISVSHSSRLGVSRKARR